MMIHPRLFGRYLRLVAAVVWALTAAGWDAVGHGVRGAVTARLVVV